MGVVEALSTHDAGEEYLGLRWDESTWTSQPEVIALKEKYGPTCVSTISAAVD